jgi:hypothetical protein
MCTLGVDRKVVYTYGRDMNTTSNASAVLIAAIAAKSTETLLECHRVIDAKTSRTQDERLVAALMADEITRRLDLDAKLDEIFSDDDFLGTYHDAIVKAMAA